MYQLNKLLIIIENLPGALARCYVIIAGIKYNNLRLVRQHNSFGIIIDIRYLRTAEAAVNDGKSFETIAGPP